MSDITQNNKAFKISHASQTHERFHKSTHANLTVFEKAPKRLYGKYKLVHGFKDIHSDPELNEIIEELENLLDEALLNESREQFCDTEPIYANFQATAYGTHQMHTSRGIKRSFSKRQLETIFEDHEHLIDMGTDPMPATCSTDKETQVFEEELIHLASECEPLKPVKKHLISRCMLTGESPKKSFFKVFTDSDKKKTFKITGRSVDSWVAVTSGDTLVKRPVLATRDGTHQDAMSRLNRIRRYLVNVHSVLNRGLQVPTYNEFPFTRERRRNTMRFRTGMIREGSIIGLGPALLSQEQINEYVRENQRRVRIENPFDSIVRPRRHRSEPASTIQTGPEFWQRLRIRAFVPSVWIYSRRNTAFPRDSQSFGVMPLPLNSRSLSRTFGERS